MIKRLINIVVAILLASVVHGQKIVRVDLVGTDSIEVVMDLPMERLRTDYQLTITPAICGTTDTMLLEPIVLHGDNYIRQAHRDFVLNAPKGSTEQTYRRAKDLPSHVLDTVLLPIAGNEWLFQDTLCPCYIKREQIGCCTEKQLGEKCGKAFAFAEPIVIPVEQPDTDELVLPVEPLQYKDSLDKFVPKRYHPKTIEGLAVQKQVPEVIRRINAGVLRSLEDYRPYTTTEILSKDSDALLVYFELDNIILKEEYRENKIILDSIIRLVDELMADTTVEIKLVQIVGLASVEGPLPHNNWLAGERADALKQYIKVRHPEMTNDMFELANGGEGWTEFRYAVENSEFFGREQVLEIVNNIKDVNERERRIKALNGGETYKYILENILLNQRNSGYIRIYYDVTDDEARVINKAIRTMQDGDNALALEMLQLVKKDPRSWNSLGVALWLNDERDEAIEWLRKAAARGDKEAIKNLEHMNIEIQ